MASVANDTKSSIKSIRRKIEPINDAGYTELCVAMVGSVDAGKSTTVGTLTTGKLDNGDGSARAGVFMHPHERESGRTSDISYQHLVDDKSKRIVSFVDLCGHEMYFKTTISGLSASYPDMAFVCVSDKITDMTKKHITLCIVMNIPIVVLFTKADIVPEAILAALKKDLKYKFSAVKKKFYQIEKKEDISKLVNDVGYIVPYIVTSNKVGTGIELVKDFIRVVNKKPKVLACGFAVEHIYNVTGHGQVVSGIVGEKVSVGDNLYMGPFQQGHFISVKVKSIHNDYRYDLASIDPGKRGCLCISINKKNKQIIRKGMILAKNIPANICKSFTAKITILHHHSTITPGYNAYVNVGVLREAVKFTKVCDLAGKEVLAVRAGNEVYIDMEFVNRLNYIEPGQSIVFREGCLRGAGTVEKINPLDGLVSSTNAVNMAVVSSTAQSNMADINQSAMPLTAVININPSNVVTNVASNTTTNTTNDTTTNKT